MTEYKTVPVEPTPKMVRAMCVAVEDTVLLESDDPQFVDAYDFWLPPVREAWAKALAAAPAVQPAAGREEIARIVAVHLPTADCPDTVCLPITMTAGDLRRLYAALAHPPAQGSESGGEATGAKAVIRDGQIVISIDVDALPLILSGSVAMNAVAGTFKVTDPAVFAKEVCYSLNDEKEDGTTRVHMMFDSAFNHAIDQGAEGVEEITEEEFEMEAARLAGAALSPQPGPASEGEGE